MSPEVLADRNLLFGILAVQNDLISRDAFFAAASAWTLAKRKAIGEILVDQGALDQEARDTIEQMIDLRVRKAGGNVRKSLESLSSVDDVVNSLAEIGDADIDLSLTHTCSLTPRQFPVADDTMVMSPNPEPLIQEPGFGLIDEMESSGPFVSDSKPDSPERGFRTGSGPAAVAAPRPAPEPQPGEIVGRFRIVRLIGRGGQGIVYEATDVSELGRRVALKTTREGRNDSPAQLRLRRASLSREGRLNAQLDHPFIMSVYGLGTTVTGRPFYAMRFLDQIHLGTALKNFHAGRSLLDDPRSPARKAAAAETVVGDSDSPADPGPTEIVSPDQPGKSAGHVRFDRLEGQRVLDFRNLLERFGDVCDAMHYSHGRRVLHRDLKPGNIMMGQHGETLVIDWGMAKTKAELQAEALETGNKVRPESISVDFEHDNRMSHDGHFIGTPGYAPPEQLAGDLTRLNETTDVYALGMILFEILTGQNPFHTDEFRSTPRDRWQTWLLKKAMAGAPDPLAINASVPRPLAAICRKALMPEQRDRYATAAALSRDVLKWLADEPVEAYRDPLSGRARRWVRKNRGKTAGLAATFVFVAISGVGFGVLQSKYNRELKQGRDRALASEIAERRQRRLALESAASAENERKLALASATDARKQRVLAETNAARAEGREKMAIDAVKQYSDAVSKNVQLKNRAELEPLRKELLKTPIEFFRKLKDELRSSKDTRPESMASLADGLYRLGQLTDVIGDKRDSRASFVEAASIYDALVAADPKSVHYRTGLAENEFSIGLTDQLMGQSRSARTHLAKALKYFDGLIEESPRNAELRFERVLTLNGLGIVNTLSFRIGEARQNLDKAVVEMESLVAADPKNSIYRGTLATSLNTLAILEVGSFRGDQARKRLVQARGLYQGLLAEDPKQNEFRYGLAACLNSLGQLDASTGRIEDARRDFAESCEAFEMIVADQPSTTAYRSSLAISLTSLGDLNQTTGRYDEAIDAYRRVTELFERLMTEDPKVTTYRTGLASNLISLGLLETERSQPETARQSYRRANEIWAKLLAEYPDDLNHRCGDALVSNNMGYLASTIGNDVEARGHFAEAIRKYEAILAVNDTMFEARRGLARTLHNMADEQKKVGQFAEARKYCLRAAEILENLIKRSLSNVDFRYALSKVRTDIALLDYEAGRYAEALRNVDLATSESRSLIDKSPDSVDFVKALARALHVRAMIFEIGQHRHIEARTDFAESARLCEALLARFPNDSRLASTLGDTLDHLAINEPDGDRAIATLESAVEMQARAMRGNPADSQAIRAMRKHWTNLIRRLGSLTHPEPVFSRLDSKLDELASQFAKSAKFSSEKGRLANAMAWWLAASPGRDAADYDRAVALAEFAVRSNPNDGDSLNTLGVALYRSGRFEAAFESLSKSVTLRSADRPHDPSPGDLAFLAMAQHKLGRIGEAEATLNRLGEIMKAPGFASDLERRGFFREASNLIRPMKLPDAVFQP